jgi:hypothetical protein
MSCLWIALTLWLLPAIILSAILMVIVIKDKLKDKPYYRPVTWLIITLLVVLGTLSVLVLINS